MLWVQAHGILMSLVWVVLIPISVIVARLCRHSDPVTARPLSLTPLGFQVHRVFGCARAAAGPWRLHVRSVKAVGSCTAWHVVNTGAFTAVHVRYWAGSFQCLASLCCSLLQERP